MARIKNQYSGGITPGSVAVAGTKGFFSLLWKTIATVFMVLFVSGTIVGTAMCIYLYGLACQPTGIDLASESWSKHHLYIYIMMRVSLLNINACTVPKTEYGLT